MDTTASLNTMSLELLEQIACNLSPADLLNLAKSYPSLLSYVNTNSYIDCANPQLLDYNRLTSVILINFQLM
jgi:hypothetical protein